MSEERSEGASFVDEDPVEYASRKAIEHRDGAWYAFDFAIAALREVRSRPDADLVDLTAVARSAQHSLSQACGEAAQAAAYQGYADAGR